MWHWDQGHLPYFQFDALRKISQFVVDLDFKTASKKQLLQSTGLKFAAPASHSVWRNYSRALKLALLVRESGATAVATPVAQLLAQPGKVTCDEYLHFLLRAFTEPSPALSDWSANAKFRYPLLFALKYLLAKTAIGDTLSTPIDEIIAAYRGSEFVGDESDMKFIELLHYAQKFRSDGKSLDNNDKRQPRESLLVMAQLSFLQVRNSSFIVSLAPEDAKDIFADLAPVIGPRASDRENEIQRLANLFADGSTSDIFEYPQTIISDVVESGFFEGSKVKKTHLVIERNQSLRAEYFKTNPSAVCDLCAMDTARTYPWTNRVLDIHHLLPLSSGTRVEIKGKTYGTTFDDLVPVCPTCHRAVHRYYDKYLNGNSQLDFSDREEAKLIYKKMKTDFKGVHFA